MKLIVLYSIAVGMVTVSIDYLLTGQLPGLTVVGGLLGGATGVAIGCMLAPLMLVTPLYWGSRGLEWVFKKQWTAPFKTLYIRTWWVVAIIYLVGKPLTTVLFKGV